MGEGSGRVPGGTQVRAALGGLQGRGHTGLLEESRIPCETPQGDHWACGCVHTCLRRGSAGMRPQRGSGATGRDPLSLAVSRGGEQPAKATGRLGPGSGWRQNSVRRLCGHHTWWVSDWEGQGGRHQLLGKDVWVAGGGWATGPGWGASSLPPPSQGPFCPSELSSPARSEATTFP